MAYQLELRILAYKRELQLQKLQLAYQFLNFLKFSMSSFLVNQTMESLINLQKNHFETVRKSKGQKVHSYSDSRIWDPQMLNSMVL